MSHPLLECSAIDQPPDEYLRSVGMVFAEFGPQTQDSGNVSCGIQVGDERYFVKTAGIPDDPRPYLGHAARVELLRNAARLSASVTHRLLPPLLGLIESPGGPLLVSPWLDGELLGVSREQRDDPQSSFQRFRRLPAPTLHTCLEAVFDLHVILARAGWIAGDFYDGSLLYDFAAGRLWAIDLDSYHLGTFRNDMGRMFGATRFMAPEEFELGALIDEQTTVFVMGRTALVFLSNGTLDPQPFRGPRALFDVAAQACEPERALRFASVAAFHHAWRAASLAA
jgi:hypothetical protein